jgi:hypothetical protein
MPRIRNTKKWEAQQALTRTNLSRKDIENIYGTAPDDRKNYEGKGKPKLEKRKGWIR